MTAARRSIDRCPRLAPFFGAAFKVAFLDSTRGADMDGGNWKEMFKAACEGDLELVHYHVERQVDIDYAHPEFLSTPLVASILAGQEAVALFLLDSGANPRLHSEFDGLAPLAAARQAGLPRVLDRLLALGTANAA